MGAPTVTSPAPSGPGGNPIVANPATPNEWPMMLIGIVILTSAVWLSSLFSEEASLWVAVLLLLAMVTYYETHGNKRFSTGLQNLLSVLGTTSGGGGGGSGGFR
jgi:uncharacterized membrane protein YgcG